MKHFLPALILSCWLTTAFASSTPLSAEGELGFVVDASQFYGSRGTLVEFALQIPNRELAFSLPDEDCLSWATYVVQLELQNDLGEVIYRKNWTREVAAKDQSQTTSESAYSLMAVRVEMEPGLYEAVVTVGDPNAKTNGKAQIPLEVQDLSSQVLSEPQLASMARQLNEKDLGDDGTYQGDPMLVKGDYLVVPLPSRRLLTPETSPLYFYLELSATPGLYNLDYQIYDQPGMLMAQFSKPLETEGSGALCLAVNPRQLSQPDLVWPDGEYRLVVNLQDKDGNSKAQREVTFWVGEELEEDAETPLYVGAPMTDTQYQQIRREISFIATGEEMQRFDAASAEARWTVLEYFWGQRDTDTSTPENEYKIEYYRRLSYVRNHFGSSTRDGLESDQGRVYLLYGQPDEVEDNPLGSGLTSDESLNATAYELEGRLTETGLGATDDTSAADRSLTSNVGEYMGALVDLNKPHMLWIYYTSSGDSSSRKFLFEDRTGFGNFEIIWSTDRGQY